MKKDEPNRTTGHYDVNTKRTFKWLDLRAGGPRGVDKMLRLNFFWNYGNAALKYGKYGTQNTAAHAFRLDLKDCCTCVPPRPEISLKIWLLDCCTARKPMRVKISCSMVYSKPQNSIWIKSYAVSSDGPFWTDCLTRTVRNWRQRAYCKLGIEIGHEHAYSTSCWI